MADLPEHSPEDPTDSQDRERIWDKETLVNLGMARLTALSDKEIRAKVSDLIWDKILWPWNEAYKEDRHVPMLFFRSDVVLHRLADLIAKQIEEARLDGELRARLTVKQLERLAVWRAEQDAKVLAAQKAAGLELNTPYFGAIGGSITFGSTPTSLGTVQTAIFCKGTEFEAELDLTDYSEW